MGEKKREIGSYFYFSESEEGLDRGKLKVEQFQKSQYLATCRSAIDVVLKSKFWTNKVALIPGFTCHAVLEPFLRNGFEVISYDINKDLSTNREQFLEVIKNHNPDVILVHDYFGFPTNEVLREKEVKSVIAAESIEVIIDKTQSMFSNIPDYSVDYKCVGSIRKWLEIPDGAFLCGVSIDGDLEEDNEMLHAMKKAMNYKCQYISNGTGNKDTLLGLYREAEMILDNERLAYTMSSLARYLFNKCDFEQLKFRRQSNYQYLLNQLISYNFFEIPLSKLNDSIVPFYFPIFVKKGRKEFQNYLAKRDIYATIIWGCPEYLKDKISDTCRRIYDEILCIPCDQRYTTDDMKYICDVVFDYSKMLLNKGCVE